MRLFSYRVWTIDGYAYFIDAATVDDAKASAVALAHDAIDWLRLSSWSRHAAVTVALVEVLGNAL